MDPLLLQKKLTNLDSKLVGAKTALRAYWQPRQENTVWRVPFQHVSMLVGNNFNKSVHTGNPGKKTLFGAYSFNMCLLV
jgi:hypothetical protein